MLTKEVEVLGTEVLGDSSIRVRQEVSIFEDGLLLTKFRSSLIVFPGETVDDKNEQIKLISKAVWTPGVLKAYKDKVAKAKIKVT